VGGATQAASTTANASSGSGGAATSSTQASSASGSGGSATSGGSGGSSSTEGSGGSGTTTNDSGSSTTGIITGDLPWSDDFEADSDGSPAGFWNPMESNGGWVVQAGDSLFYAPTNVDAANRNLTWAGDPSWTNMRLQVDVRLSSGGDDTRIYIGVRAAEAGSKLDYYFGYLEGDGDVRIGRYIGGSTGEESSSLASGVDPTVWNTLALSVDGDALSLSVNDSEVVTHTLTGLDAGVVALGVQGGLAEFDNVMVAAP
jgi:hypothetical protein